jgi:hypothetical protein
LDAGRIRVVVQFDKRAFRSGAKQQKTGVPPVEQGEPRTKTTTEILDSMKLSPE